MRFAKSTARWIKTAVVAIDDIYADPDRVRRWALEQEYSRPEDLTGYRSSEARIFPGAVKRLRQHFGPELEITDDDTCGVVYFALAKGRKAETPGVHWDFPENTYVGLIYLTPGLPADCGTSFWKHKQTGLTRAPVRADEQRLGMSCEELYGLLERDSETRSRWIEIDRIGYRYNRLVAFPAYVLHSATRHYGGTLNNGRIYQMIAFRA